MKKVLIALLTILAVSGTGIAEELKSVNEALEALKNKNVMIAWKAAEYLAKSKIDEVFPLLTAIVKNKKDSWIMAERALIMINNERVVDFYIELLKDNYFEKAEKAERIIYGMGSKHGCIKMTNVYGSTIVSGLGELKNPKAIPVLKEALVKGDEDVIAGAYIALYRLEQLSIDQLIVEAKKEKNKYIRLADKIESLGWENIGTNSNLAIEIFDKIIKEFLPRSYEAAGAHYWKIQCYTLLKQYDKALKECDEVSKFTEYSNLTDQMPTKREEILRIMNSSK